MNEFTRHSRVLTIVGAVLIAGLLGFALARFTLSPSAPPVTSAPPVSNDQLIVPESSLTTMDIGVEAVASGDLSAQVSAAGSVAAAPGGQAIISAHASGTVSRISKRLGDRVTAGETLALVTSRDAAGFAAERRAAEAKAELARSVLKRERELFEQRVTPRQDLESAQAQADAAEAEAARARIAAQSVHVSADGESLAVVSPIAGQITSASAALGAFVEPDTELFRVADPRVIVVEAAIPASDARRVNAGDAAEVVTQGGATLHATVSSITPTVSLQTGSVAALLSLNDPSNGLAPGEYVRVRILPKSGSASTIIVPDEAVQRIDGRDAVFVRTDNGFKVRAVKVTARNGDRAAIASGLSAGERVATRNAFLLKAELGKGAEEEE